MKFVRQLFNDAVSWIAVLILALALIASLLVRSAVVEEEAAIHAHQAGKVTAILESSMTSIDATLTLLSESFVPADEAGGIGFEIAASGRLEGATVALFAAVPNGEEFVVAAAVGDGPPVGDALDEDLADLARRALNNRGALATGVVDSDAPDTRWLLTALASADGPVVIQINIVQPQQPLEVEPESPFADLNLAVYASDRASDDTRLLTTTAVPLGNEALRTEFTVGGDTWLLVSTPKGSLVGRFAASVWLIVLAGGIVSAAAVAAMRALTSRRHQYAETLVEKRTIELRSAMQQLADARDGADAANASKNDFLSRMSHELRTPLNGVLGFAQILELGDLDNDQTDSVKQILKAGNHLLLLINEVLDISRIEAGNISVSLEPVLLSDVIDETTDLQRLTANEASISFDVTMHCSCDHYVIADRQRLKQIILNLTSNAIKYNRTNGTVTISCECDGNLVHLRITDTGRGIPNDKLPLLFLPFERLGAEHTTIEGTGIGLALSHKLAQALGGQLELERTGDNGSTFKLTLDNAEGQTQRYERLQPNRSTEPSVGSDVRANVLYVEDNLSNITLVEKILHQRPGIRLIPAMQGRLAVELAESHQPDLILLDLHLPDINGDEVLEVLRTNPATTHIPVVMVSADATTGQIRRLLNAGATDYITKPLNVDTFLDIVDRATLTTPTLHVEP